MALRCDLGLQVRVRLLRVLVVDDNHDTADSLTMLLRLWGYDVRSAYGGAVAVKMAAEVRPDVLLLDVAMPAVTGCEVARRLRRHRRFEHTRIVAVSGYVDEDHRVICRAAGFDDFLVKPLEMATLAALLTSERERLPRLTERAPHQPSINGQCITAEIRRQTGYGWPDQGLAVRLHPLAG